MTPIFTKDFVRDWNNAIVKVVWDNHVKETAEGQKDMVRVDFNQAIEAKMKEAGI